MRPLLRKAKRNKKKKEKGEAAIVTYYHNYSTQLLGFALRIENEKNKKFFSDEKNFFKAMDCAARLIYYPDIPLTIKRDSQTKKFYILKEEKQVAVVTFESPVGKMLEKQIEYYGFALAESPTFDL